MNRIILIGLLVLISLKAYAAPTLQGASGLIRVPSAEPLDYNKTIVGIDYNLEKDSHIYKFNIGGSNTEIGFSGGTVPTEGVFVNAKYFLISDNERFAVSVAVGIENIGSKDNMSTYMVSSKKFPGGWSGHFGFKATLKSELEATAMFGVQYMMDERISLIGDFIGESNNYSANAGMRYYIERNIIGQISMTDITSVSKNGMAISMGISIENYL